MLINQRLLLRFEMPQTKVSRVLIKPFISIYSVKIAKQIELLNSTNTFILSQPKTRKQHIFKAF